MKHIYQIALSVLFLVVASELIASDKPEMVSKDKLLAVSMLMGGKLKLSNQVPVALQDFTTPTSMELFAVLDNSNAFVQLFTPTQVLP